MLNNFTYQLELNELNKADTKHKLKTKISSYNRQSFNITAGCKIELYLPLYSSVLHTDRAISNLLYFKLLQLAIDKYVSTYDIEDLPIYAQHMSKINFTIQLKENPNG